VPRLREGKGSFRLFTEGDDLYNAMIAAIGAARGNIRLESFIFAADETGWRFARALAARARAGLDVRFHFDSGGAAFRPSPNLERELVEAGVRLKWYNPWSWRHPSRYFQRNHRKLLVVDEQEAFLGGFNIRLENSRLLYGEDRQRDTHVRVHGELARQAAALFDRLWTQAEDPHVDAIPEDASEVDALLLPNFSRHCQRRLACIHAGLIAGSRRTVYITTPYFCPGTVIGQYLREAARRGVDVRLLVPRNSDPPIAGWTTRSAYSALLGAGVRIYEYLPRKLHAKTSVIDGEWAVIGSANLDYLSLFVNHELVLIARVPDLGEALRDLYRRDLGDAAEVLPSQWSERGWRERCVEVFGRTARRFL
jgi:cardiolipin synthase